MSATQQTPTTPTGTLPTDKPRPRGVLARVWRALVRIAINLAFLTIPIVVALAAYQALIWRQVATPTAVAIALPVWSATAYALVSLYQYVAARAARADQYATLPNPTA